MFSLFSRFSAVKQGTSAGSFWFLVDNERVGYINDIDFIFAFGQGSTSIILELTAGQLVRIENSFSTQVFGTHPEYGQVSWFTGFLLSALE